MKIGSIQVELKVDDSSIKQALSRLDLNQKQQLALEATLRGVDLESVIETMEDLWSGIQPAYEKNLAALNASRCNRCEKCGVILFDDSELCPECQENKL